MPGKPYPVDVIEQAQAVLDAWKQIDKELTFGSLNFGALQKDIAESSPLLSQLNTLDAQLTDLRNQRDTLYQSMWDKVKRVRAAVKGIYGDDSSQYEMVGGTRLSERKSPARKQPAAS